MTHRSPDPGPSLQHALSAFLAADGRTRLLGLGEPTHGDDTHLALRNDLFVHLVEAEGFVAIALETDAAAAAALDAYVRGLDGDLDAALRDGFSHGFGRFPGNRDLLVRLRRINAGRPDDEAVRCLGFDTDTELTAEDYRLPDRVRAGAVERTRRMVENLEAILAGESHRGRILVHAHHSHLHRTRSRMRLGPHEISWDPVGAVLTELHGSGYAVLLTSCGASPARGVPSAPVGTLEHLLDARGPAPSLLSREELADLIAAAATPLHQRDDLTPAMALAPLDPATVLEAADGVVHVVRGEVGPPLIQDDLRRLLGALPDVAVDVAGPASGAPEVAWGDTFFTVQPDGQHDPRRMPFATLVTKDYPGFDETSELDRDGVFALNLGVGSQLFQGLLGFAPREAAEHAGRFDPTATGVLMPHPLYAAQGWVRVINPPAAQEVQLVALATEAARRRHPRAAAERTSDPTSGDAD